ncbi:n-acetylglutamate synthase [Joostella sp. CR20]|uniref:n-acetylglutamate synthase n=1 Tax=Joostella sp. CR20 TaxID=2804312 RepID=UPI00313E32B5
MNFINYHNKSFRAVSNSENGQTSEETIFYYKQEGNILTAKYSGGAIKKGHLIGLVSEDGVIDMRYHQIDIEGNLRTGKCKSIPETLEDGSLRLHESWEWTSDDFSKGTSVIEEII